MFNILQATAYSSNFRGKEEEEEKEEEGTAKKSRGSYVYGGTNESV
jgi:hypothetical protein